ncbi:hypothetical protein [Brumimicrobium mesophilum]|uniref:hypothetical protein n=1 Tax=Brumimicrobium mesophilum TaxID=392717 RepID=UPI000D144BA4|nr:hypothetical protein [Brumimicrobium mesophilum]
MIQFDVNNIVENNISPRLRKVFTLAFFKACASPLVVSFSTFYQFYEDKKYELLFNGQVIYLEHLLNDQFDNINRGIYITDAPQQADQIVLYNENENNEETVIFNIPENEPPIVTYNYSEMLAWPDFIVNIPSSVVFNQTQLKAYVNKYKLAGKNYIINIV